VQGSNLVSYIIYHLLAVRFGDISLGGHGHDERGPERLPFEHAAPNCLANEIAIDQRGLLRGFDLGAQRPVVLSRSPLGVDIRLPQHEIIANMFPALPPFSLKGNIGAILWRILDAYWLSEEEHDKIRDPFI